MSVKSESAIRAEIKRLQIVILLREFQEKPVVKLEAILWTLRWTLRHYRNTPSKAFSDFKEYMFMKELKK